MEATSLDDSSIAKVSIMKTKKKSLFAWFGRTVAVGLVPLMMVGCATDNSSNNDKNTTTNIDLTYSTEPTSGESVVGSSVIKVTFSKAVSGFTVDSNSADTTYGSVYLTKDDGSYVPMTYTQSGNSYILDPTGDLVTGDYNLVIGFGGTIKDGDGAVAPMTTTAIRVEDALNSMTTNLTADLAAVTGLAASDQASIVQKASTAGAAVSNNLGAVIPAALEAALDDIGASTTITDATVKTNAKSAAIASMLALVSDATTLDAEGRKVARITDTTGFTTLLENIGSILTKQAVKGYVSSTELSTLVGTVQDNLAKAGATSDQVTTYSQSFTTSLNTSLNSVTDATFDKSTYTTAVSDATGTAAAVAQNIALTTGVDALTGGSGDDSFIASAGGTATLNAGDQLTGASGTDSLKVSVSADVITSGVTLSGVETVAYTNYDTTGGSTFSLGSATGVTTVSNTGTGSTTFSDAPNIMDIVGSGSGNVTISYAATAIAGTADTQNISVNAFTGSVISSGAETVSISSSGSASTIATLDTGTASTTLNINAGANLTITTDLVTDNGNLATIDASASTANVSLTSTDTGTTSITLGSGDDTLKVVGRTLSATADSFDAGDGTDTLAANAARVNSSAITSARTNMVGFETLTVLDGTAAGTFTAANVSSTINRVNLDNVSGAATVTLPAGTATLGIKVNATPSALTVNDTGTATNDNLTVINTNSSTSSTDAFNAAGHTFSGFEGVTFNTGTYSTAVSQDLGAVSVDPDTGGSVTVTFTGGNPVQTFTSLTSSTVGTLTIDASGLTAQSSGDTFEVRNVDFDGVSEGTLNITGSPGNDNITITSATGGGNISGGAGADSLTGGTGADTIAGGAGNDSLVGAGGNDVITGGDGADTITATVAGAVNIDAGAGNDTVSLGSTLGATDTVMGGEGIDTLNIEADLSSTSAVGVSGFETVQIGGSATTLDVYPIRTGLTKVVLSSSGSVAVSNVGADVTDLLLDATVSLSPTFARLTDTAADSLNVTIDGADAATTALTANNEETITVSSDNASAVTITTLTASDLTSLNVSGSGAVTLGTITAALLDRITVSGSGAHSIGGTANTSLTLSTIDASGSTGSITVSGGSSLDPITFTAGSGSANITGGAGADTLTAGSAASTLNGGAGADTITGGNGNDSLLGGAGNDTISTGTGSDNVTGGAGTDTITLGTGVKYVTSGRGSTISITAVTAGMSVAGIDVITGVGNDDFLIIPVETTDNYTITPDGTPIDYTFDNESLYRTSAVPEANLDNTTYGNNVTFFRGVYSAGSALFSPDSSGSDTLLVYDDNGTDDGVNFLAIMLQGSTVDNATIDNASATSGGVLIDFRD